MRYLHEQCLGLEDNPGKTLDLQKLRDLPSSMWEGDTPHTYFDRSEEVGGKRGGVRGGKRRRGGGGGRAKNKCWSITTLLNLAMRTTFTSLHKSRNNTRCPQSTLREIGLPPISQFQDWKGDMLASSKIWPTYPLSSSCSQKARRPVD